MVLFYKSLSALTILLYAFLTPSTLTAQSNPEQDYRERIVRINSVEWEHLSKNAVFKKLDSLQSIAAREDDERLLWYCRAYRQLANNPPPATPAIKLSQYEALLKYLGSKCPVTEVTAHFRCMYAKFCLDFNRPDKGFKALFLAKEQFERSGYENLPGAGEYLYIIGLGYYKYEDYGNCIKSLELGKRYQLTSRITPVLMRNLLGMAYLKTLVYQSAKKNFLETTRLAAVAGDSAYIGIGLGNYGNALRLERKPAEALPYFYKSLAINRYREPGSAALTYVYTAKALLVLDSVSKARQLLDSATLLSRKNNSYNIINYRRQYLEAAVLYYRKTGNNKVAAMYLDSTIKVKDSLRLTFNKKVVALTEWTIAAEQQRAAIAQAEKDREAIVERRGVIAAVIVVALLALSFALYRRHAKLLVERKIQEEQKRFAEAALADATAQLASYLQSNQEKNNLIDDINKELDQLRVLAEHSVEHQERSREIEEQRKKLFESVILTEKDWIHFQRLFDFVYPDFLEDLNRKYPALTSNEIRLMLLLKLGISNKQMAFMLGVSIAAVRKSRQRLRKKLDLIDPEHDLEGFVDDDSLQ